MQGDIKKTFLLRYSDYHGIKTIDEHCSVIERTGYCWFGKYGKKPQKAYLDGLFADGKITMFLYTASTLHRAIVTAYTYDPPDDGIPEYYSSWQFRGEDYKPSVYFKVLSIEPACIEELDGFVVSSSGKGIRYDLKKSISSFYILQPSDTWTPPQKKSPKKAPEQKKKPVSNTCVYRKNGTCTNRRSVSYQYECERPSNCNKQKPVMV